MPLLQYVEPGGEKFLPFAKRKLEFWHKQMLESGVSTLSKAILVDDGSTIYVDSVHMGKARFNDRIRITGGQGFKWVVGVSILVDDPIPTRTPPVEPTDHGNEYSFGPQVAWEQGGFAAFACYASMTLQYRWTDTNGLEFTEEIATYLKNGTIGIDPTVGGSVPGDTQVAVDWTHTAGPPATFLIDTHLGYPRYGFADGSIRVLLERDLHGSTPHTAFIAAHAAWVTAYNSFWLDYYNDSFSGLSSQVLAGALTDKVRDAIKASHPSVTWTDSTGEHTSNVQDGERVDVFYVDYSDIEGTWGYLGQPPHYPPHDGDFESHPYGAFKYIGRLKYVAETDSFAAAFQGDGVTPSVTEFKDPEVDGVLRVDMWKDLPDITSLRLYDQTFAGLAFGQNVWLVWLPKADPSGVAPEASRPVTVYTPQEQYVQGVLSSYPATSSAALLPYVLLAAATPQPQGYEVSPPAPPPPPPGPGDD